MDCNKDEALRAKEIAEKKMEKNDFEGARQIAKKAQSIYPKLENISQLLTVCDVHCSSLKRVLGSEKDWYEILQVKRLADESTVKKQYRRLALFLHPDKNRFPGAEAAFKLICEANAVLSDPAKKSLYDSKIRVAARSASVHPHLYTTNKTFQFNNAQGVQGGVYNGFTNLNLHQTAGSSSFSKENFWTSCPFCSNSYKYTREFVNKSVRCLKCLKDFMACEISSQGIPLGSKWGPHCVQPVPSKPGSNQPAAFQEKVVVSQGNIKVDGQSLKRSSTGHTDSSSNAGRRVVQTEQGLKTGSCTNDAQVVGTSNGDSTIRESGNLKRKGGQRGKKGRRKQVVESSESFNTSSESDFEDVSNGANVTDSTNKMNSESNGVHFPRRSTRKRQHVVYNETDDDDSPSPSKGTEARKSPKEVEEEQNVVFGGDQSIHDTRNSSHADADYSKSKNKQTGAVYPEGSLRDNGCNPVEQVRLRAESGGKQRTDADTIKVKSDSDQDSYSSDNPDVELYHCPDADFYNFDHLRDERGFKVDDVWACYDELDSMPRFYAKVKKINKSPFHLWYTWLEADCTNEAAKRCADEQLPVTCGCFRLGKTETTSSLLQFSHKMCTGKGPRRGSYIIYPREGETWAIFSNLDKRSSSDPKTYDFKYEIVEVLSNFLEDTGIKVIYLDKITGFISLFKRTSQSGADGFFIRPNELYKFSHLVPHHKLNGDEREGVPEGSFELDPASLPLNPDDLYCRGKTVMEPRILNRGSNSQQSRLSKGKSVLPEGASIPKEFVDLEDLSDEDF